MSPKILVIEDDPYVQRMYKRMFGFQKYQTEIASNGEEGLKIIKKEKPDLVLLDIILPGMNGLEVLKKIRENSQSKNIPVLMLTNVGEAEMVEEANKLGAQSYMIKANFSPDQVIKEINKYIVKK
jgi:DNA-binding response OmpR family regulator